MTDTPTPAASDAIEAAMDVIVHAIACKESFGPDDMRSAIAAYHAALPSEHANLKQELSGFSPYSLGGLSLAAITALEARLADARAEMQAAANQFQFYADEHVKKGSYDKAATNCDWARRLQEAAEKMANG